MKSLIHFVSFPSVACFADFILSPRQQNHTLQKLQIMKLPRIAFVFSQASIVTQLSIPSKSNSLRLDGLAFLRLGWDFFTERLLLLNIEPSLFTLSRYSNTTRWNGTNTQLSPITASKKVTGAYNTFFTVGGNSTTL